MKPVLRLSVLAFAALVVVGAATPSPADDTTAKVDKLFSQWDTTVTPGCALAVIKDGRIIYERGYGMAKLEDGIVMTPDKIFDVGSVSKQFTAACIAILVRQGKVGLDDEVQKYFPRLPRYEHPVTVRHLIHHTSGLRDYNELLSFAGFRPESDCPNVDEALEVIFRQKGLNHPPGEEFSYTNTGYFLLGQIIEQVSGQSLNAFAQDHLFKPLGMIHTLYQDNHLQLIRNRATGYDSTDRGYQIDLSNWDETGDGNVYTSVEDLFLWDQAFYNHKLGGDFTDKLQEVGVLNSGKKLDYAFGLTVGEYKGLKNVEHGGAWVGFRAAMSRFPEQKFTVICLANLSDINPSALCNQVADIYLAGLLKEPGKAAQPENGEIAPVTLSPAELEEKTGRYRAEKMAMWVEVTRAGDRLKVAVPIRLQRGAGHEFTFVPTSKTMFVASDAPAPLSLEFLPETAGRPREAILTVRGDRITFVKAKPLSRLMPDELKAYAGEYTSPELLDARYRFFVDGDKLIVRFRAIPDTPLQPMAPDIYNAGFADIDFRRDASGRVTGFTLSSGRMLGIVFVKTGA